MMRLFPPFLFSRISLQHFEKDFRGCLVKVNRSLLNINMNRTIFGGTIFSACDPFYAILYWQIFARKKIRVQTWLKSAQIRYLKPADTDLFVRFHLSEEEIAEAEAALNSDKGKFVKSYTIEMINKRGEVCVIAETEVYIRRVNSSQKELSGF